MRNLNLLLLLVMLLAACGGKVDAPQSFPAGYTVAKGNEVALALPADWVAVPVSRQDFVQMANKFRDTNPALAQRMDDMAAELDEDTLRLAAFHDNGTTNVNIAAQGVSLFESLDNHAAANRRGLENVGYEILTTDEVSLNGQNAARTTAQIRLNTGNDTSLTMMLVQYTLIVGSTAYSISFGTPSYQYDEFENEFQEIANTFHTVD